MSLPRKIGRLIGKASRLVPGASARRRSRREAAVSAAVAAFIERHWALGVAVLVNASIVMALGCQVLARHERGEPGIQASLGFLTEPPPPPPPAGGASSVDMAEAMSRMMDSASAPVSPIVTTLPSPLQFKAPETSAFAPPDLSAAMQSRPDAANAAARPSASIERGKAEETGTGGGGLYGDGVGSGIEGKPGGPGVSPIAVDTSGKAVGGMSVVAERLGVVMEVSEVTIPLLPKVAAQIRASFPGCVQANVIGCGLHDHRKRRFEALIETAARRAAHGAVTGNSKTDDSTFEAILSLVEVDKVDAIFWFTDMYEHEQTDHALLSEVRDHLVRKKVRLYIRKVGASFAPDFLVDFARSTGGDIKE